MPSEIQEAQTEVLQDGNTPPEESSAFGDGESDVNWGDVGSLDDDSVDTIEGDTTVVVPPAEVDAAAATAVETPAAATPAEVPAAAPTQAPPAVVEPPPAASPAATDESFDVVKWRSERLAELEQSYKLSDEEALAMQTEPELVLPKLASLMHLRLTESIFSGLQTMLPQMIQQLNTVTARETEAKNLFFSNAPDLDKPEYHQAILEVGAMFRRVNPNATPQEAATKIAQLARVSLGLSTPQSSVQTVSAEVPPPPAPFTPARGGSGAGAIPAPKNEWLEILGEDGID